MRNKLTITVVNAVIFIKQKLLREKRKSMLPSEQRGRFINIRIPVLCAISVCLGTVFSYLHLVQRISIVYPLLLTFIPFIIAFYFLIMGIIHRKELFIRKEAFFSGNTDKSSYSTDNFSHNSSPAASFICEGESSHVSLVKADCFVKNVRRAICFMLIAVFFIAGGLSFYLQYGKMNVNTDKQNVTVVMRVNSTCSVKNGYIDGYFEDVSILSDEGTIKLDGNVRFYGFYSADSLTILESGDIIEVSGVLYGSYPYKDGVDSEYVRNNVKYILEGDGNHFSYMKGKPDIFDKAADYIKSSLFASMDNESASVAVALILGDRGSMSQMTAENYRKSGLAHLFSVSGLHIGFVSLIAGVLMHGCAKKNKWAAFVLSSMLIWGYAAICGFPSSAVRAALMATVFSLLAPYRKGDLICVLSFSLVIIVLFNPSALFDVGTQMSFSAVFGIACVSRPVSVTVKRYVSSRTVGGIINAFAVSLGAGVGTLPFVALYYGEISLFSVITNTVLVAAMTVAFVLCAVSLVPFLSFVAKGAVFIISFVGKIADIVADLPLIEFSAVDITAGIFIVSAVFMVIIGGFIRMKGKTKIIAIAVCIALIFIIPIVNGIAPQRDVIKADGETVSFCSSEKEMFLLCDVKNEYDVYLIEKALSLSRAERVYLCVKDLDDSREELLSRLILSEKTICGIVAEDADNLVNGSFIREAGLTVEKDISIGETHVYFFKSGWTKAFILERNGKRFIWCYSSRADSADKLYSVVGSADFVYCNSNSGAFAEKFACTVYTREYSVRTCCFSEKIHGDFTFEVYYGIINEV